MSARNRRQSQRHQMAVQTNDSNGSPVIVKNMHQYSATKIIGKIILAGYHNGNG